jgi:hypothetical protein
MSLDRQTPAGAFLMTWCRILVVSLALAGTVSSAPAADFGIFGRKPKGNPAERVPELLIQLKTGRDESQRVSAADELHLYDPKAFPEITTALIDALGRDASPAVRAEAADSLGKLRPISQKVGYVLEQAVANDGSLRVRLSARQALWQYHLVGYRSGKPTEPDKATGEPIVSAPPGPSTPAAGMQPPYVAAKVAPTTKGSVRETAEPPLADGSVPAIDLSPKAAPAAPVSRPAATLLAPFKLIPSANKPAPKVGDSVPAGSNASGNGPMLPPPPGD